MYWRPEYFSEKLTHSKMRLPFFGCFSNSCENFSFVLLLPNNKSSEFILKKPETVQMKT